MAKDQGPHRPDLCRTGRIGVSRASRRWLSTRASVNPATTASRPEPIRCPAAEPMRSSSRVGSPSPRPGEQGLAQRSRAAPLRSTARRAAPRHRTRCRPSGRRCAPPRPGSGGMPRMPSSCFASSCRSKRCQRKPPADPTDPARPAASEADVGVEPRRSGKAPRSGRGSARRFRTRKPSNSSVERSAQCRSSSTMAIGPWSCELPKEPEQVLEQTALCGCRRSPARATCPADPSSGINPEPARHGRAGQRFQLVAVSISLGQSAQRLDHRAVRPAPTNELEAGALEHARQAASRRDRSSSMTRRVSPTPASPRRGRHGAGPRGHRPEPPPVGRVQRGDRRRWRLETRAAIAHSASAVQSRAVRSEAWLSAEGEARPRPRPGPGK